MGLYTTVLTKDGLEVQIKLENDSCNTYSIDEEMGGENFLYTSYVEIGIGRIPNTYPTMYEHFFVVVKRNRAVEVVKLPSDAGPEEIFGFGGHEDREKVENLLEELKDKYDL